MARLTKKLGLNDALIEKLEQNKIFTALDLVQEDSEKLSIICCITFKDVLEIRQNVISHYSALPVSGTSAYQQLLTSSALIPSGIRGLDELLHGGFLTGTVFELCGLSGDGKTQTCLSLTAHVAVVLKQVVHYVDTKGDFSARRVLEIIKHKNISEEDCNAALERIDVTKIDDIYELVRYLHSLRSSLEKEESSPPRVIIVDSMPSLYFPFMGTEGTQGFGLLNHAMAMMKTLATEYHILIIEVNLASTIFVDSETSEVENPEEDEAGDIPNQIQAAVIDPKPMLGKYWLHAPNTRLLVSKINNDSPQRTIKVTKSTYLPVCASCTVNVTSEGVV